MSKNGADATTPTHLPRQILFQNQSIVGYGGKSRPLWIGHWALANSIKDPTEVLLSLVSAKRIILA